MGQNTAPKGKRGQSNAGYSKTTNEETRNSELESNSFLNMEGILFSAPYNFIVQRFQSVESKFIVKGFKGEGTVD